MRPPRNLRSMVALLQYRSQVQADERAYTFLDKDGEEIHSISYRELDRRSRVIASELQRLGASGERALLLYPPSLDFITALLACLYAGIVAVPSHPPHPARPTRTLRRLPGIVADARPGLVLCTSEILAVKSQLCDAIPELSMARWLDTDQSDKWAGNEWEPLNPESDSLAFLQYTSGSTDSPKGVMISHGNLLGNLESIHACEENAADSVAVTWLPPYHDMGLVEGLFQPLFGGYPCYQMAPTSFLQRPALWLETISKYAATNSGAPNFAYDLCVRRTTPEQRRGLQLSHWRVAYCGGEPVRWKTLERFREAFEPCGFKWRSFYPVYGLAEATLVVSSGFQSSPPVQREVDAKALGRDRAVNANGGVSVSLVSCGPPAPGTSVAIVRPGSAQRCEPDEVGEIWVSGTGVARGYWNRALETHQTFECRLQGDNGGRYLRSGDLGLMWNGELFVTGRLKNVIIVRGRKHYAEDVESVVEHCHPAIHPSGCVAFPVDLSEGEGLAVVAEVNRRHLSRLGGPSEPTLGQGAAPVWSVIETVRQTVVEQHEVMVHAVTLVMPGSIPRTTSGKLRRQDCRRAFLAKELNSVAEWVHPTQPVLSTTSRT